MNAISSQDLVFDQGLRHRSGLRDLRTEALADIIRNRTEKPIQRLLVVGCGSGKEAAVLSDILQAETVGIDLIEDFDSTAASVVKLQRGDATKLDFPDASFDFVFSYHALEHIPEHAIALNEMSRVLRPGGGFCIGTPNRTRLLAYFGSPDTSVREKIRWNLIDWKARLRGRFRNEYGAHAGFSSLELQDALNRAFGDAEDITLQYYLRVYRNHTAICRGLESSGLGRFIYPCVYFLGHKPNKGRSVDHRPSDSKPEGRNQSPERSFRGLNRVAGVAVKANLAGLLLSGWLIPGEAFSQTLLFRSGFSSVTSLRAVNQSDCWSSGCYQYFEPYSDLTSGYSWPPTIWGGSTTRFTLLADASTTASELREFMFNQLVTVKGPSGSPTSALFSQITRSGCCGSEPQGGGATQLNFGIEPASEPSGSSGDLYISYWVKYQEGMAKLMDVGTVGSGWHWRSPFVWKTNGDYRVALHIRRDPYINGGNLFWRLIGDNEANGGLPYKLFWQLDNMTIPVPVGEWFKFEVFWHRSLGSDGRVWVAIQRVGQARQVIFDRYGRNMASSNPADLEYGFSNSPRPINRIFLSMLYGSSSYPMYQWMDDLEIWNAIP